MSFLRWFKRRFALDQDDFEDEVRAHLRIAAEDRMAEGEDRRSAQLASLKDFGNIARTTEAARQVWRPRWFEALHDLANDVRHSVRGLAKNPGFALTVIGVFALGIGLNATVFTMLKSMALTPLAGVENSARLAVLFRETNTGRNVAVSYPDYRHFRDHHRGFSGLMGTSLATVSLGRGRDARRAWAELVTGTYFPVLGVKAQRGRMLAPSDEIAPGGHPVVVLSDSIWRRDFGADETIIGRTITVNNVALTVVGVADAAYHGTIVSYDVDLFLPVMMAPQIANYGVPAASLLADRTAGLLFVHGHLRPGATLAAAAAETDAIWAVLDRTRPADEAAQRMKTVSFFQSPNGAQTYMLPSVTVLSGMALLVLAIACANIAGLVLVRGVSRRGEVAVRLALGAKRSRVVRLLVIESLVLALPGAAIGVALAARGILVLVGYAEWLAAPERLFFNIQVDGLVIAYAALAACLSVLLFGLVPALRISRVDLVRVINEDSSARGAGRGRMRAALVVAQVAVSLLLLVGSGLVSRSLEAARKANPGFQTSQTTAVSIDVRHNAYDAARGQAFYRNLLRTARTDAGTEAATLAAHTPLNLLHTRAQAVQVDGYAAPRGEDLTFLSNTVGPDYFRTLRIPLRAGREFDEHDDASSAATVIVNQTFAQRFWGGAQQALGKRIRVAEGEWRTVVGVAADVKYLKFDEAPQPYFYLPFLQAYRTSMILHTRGKAPVDELIEQARARIAALDPDLPILSARPMAEMIRGAFIFFDLTAAMLFVFGVAGMALAALGTYGLVSYNVRTSTREIGIRMALGASAAAIVRAFLRRGLWLGGIGVAIGVVAALAASRLLAGALYGVSATDAVSFARALGIVLGGVILATAIPAWRASRTNATSALRHQ